MCPVLNSPENLKILLVEPYISMAQRDREPAPPFAELRLSAGCNEAVTAEPTKLGEHTAAPLKHDTILNQS